ncbi:S9 family peptidase [Actinoalloteichus caeruleus]|uniref:S9 family peptidase n=1 Tax=Actinoalloteichus cyanogriseus TaxID=2893586 RepID=UPI003BB8E08C
MVTISRYGTWTSPISADDAAAAGGGPLLADTHREQVWWTESRPAEGGRVALLRANTPGDAREVLGAPWNVRNRLHEYGGRPWVVFERDGRDLLAFTHWADQRVYLLELEDPAAEPRAISPAPEIEHGFRYGDLAAGPGGDEVWCVREEVTGEGRTDIRRDLVALPVTGAAGEDPGGVRVLAASHHFMTGARPSPDGRHAAWIGWNHPAMPWDGTELCVADIDESGELSEHRVLCGDDGESVCQAEWASADALTVSTDPDGWWNLFRVELDGTRKNLGSVREELGGPLWQVGARWFADLGDGRFAVLRSGALALLDSDRGELTGLPVDVGSSLPSWGPTLAVRTGEVLGVAAGPRHGRAVVAVDPDSGRVRRFTATPGTLPDERYLPVPEERTFTGPDGERIPAYLYRPRNPDFAAADDELPPFLVHAHGGPTGRVSPVLDIDFAYFTSRGIGVVAVNYGGSTGYGREFRERLRENWGVVDVGDCATVARALGAEGIADPDRIAIRGGSAGGWTTASSLTCVDTYRCGTAMYPVLDLEGWANGGTHDFESRYLDGLVGPYPEQRERYRQRAPVNRVQEMLAPLLVLQGLEDEICPADQCERFVAALAEHGVPHAYLAFAGEQHGFRRADTIRAVLQAELSFYGQVLGFEAADVPELEIQR